MRLHLTKDYFAPGEPVVVKFRRTGTAVKLHAHDYFELMCVLCGQGTQRIGTDNYSFAGGSMFLIPGGIGHMISFSAETEYYDILIRNEAFSAIRTEALGLPLSALTDNVTAAWCRADLSGELRSLLQLAQREYENQTGGSGALLLSFLEILLTYLARNRGLPDEEGTAEKRRSALPQILDYINGHFSEPLRLCDVAERYHYAPNALSKRFRRKYGMTFQNYLHSRRIRAAKEQLKISTDTISDIYRTVGYSNSSEFYRVFREQTGMTPKEYRRKTEQDRLWEDLSMTNSGDGQTNTDETNGE